jgi:hypothetical protein
MDDHPFRRDIFFGEDFTFMNYPFGGAATLPASRPFAASKRRGDVGSRKSVISEALSICPVP